MQTELGRGDLLDASGQLIARGWARDEARRYRRAAITAGPLRSKEWDYYCVLAGDFGLAVTVADLDYLGLASLTWFDFRVPSAISKDVISLLPLGRMGLPESADHGDVAFSSPKLSLAFRHAAGGRTLSIDCPAFQDGAGLKGELFLAQPTPDRMTIATPFAGAPKAFYYNQKINCMPASGEIAVGGEVFQFEPAKAFGVLDWGRGVWTYHNRWYWGSASGLLDGIPFGFNIGHGFGDTSAASENMLFHDGRAHKLGQVTFHLPEGAHDSAPWRFTSDDGRFEMSFEPIIDRVGITDLLIIRSAGHQVFGRYSGTCVLDDGRKLTLDRFLGFAEEVDNRW